MCIRRIPFGRYSLALFTLLTMTACAMPEPGAGHRGHHGNPMQSAGGMMGGRTMSGGPGGQIGMSGMDKDGMCAMHRRLQGAATEQERQAMMDQWLKDRSPEMRQQQMEMMRRQCR